MINRFKLLFILAIMPEEAFSWFVAWCSGGMVQFPDGLDGFKPDSREAISQLRKAAEEYK